MKLSNHFRKLHDDYIKRYGIGNIELHWKFVIIYTYHEYAISSYYNCNKLYSEYQSVSSAIPHTNDPDWIFAENSYHSAVFWIYTNGAILLDLLRSVNDIIRTSDNKLLINELNIITKEFHKRIIEFKDTRNNVTAHPYEEWSDDMRMRAGLLQRLKRIFCSKQGEKSIRYVTPVSSEGSGGHLTKLVFRMFDTQKKDFSEEIKITPYNDISLLNEYVEKLGTIYRKFFQL